MPKQLNIRSDRAYESARRLAVTMNESMTVVVEAALEAYEANLPPKFRPEPTPEEAAETYRILCEFAEAFSARKEPGESSDHSYLYDEKGLPI